MPNIGADTIGGLETKRRIQVAVGLILNAARDCVLVSKRAEEVHQGGFWEFPGGKVEPAEDVLAALSRELHEELGIRPLCTEPVLVVSHDYPDKQIALNVCLIEAFEGEPEGREGQPVTWVSIDELDQLAFPPANGSIITWLQARYRVGGSRVDPVGNPGR